MISYYCSNHVLGFGRFVVVTTNESIKGTGNVFAEAFVFCFDTPGLYSGLQIQYNYQEGDDSIIEDSTAYLEREAVNQARIIIQKYQNQKYQETRDCDYLRDGIEFHNCEPNILISLKVTAGYEKELAEVGITTQSSELQDVLKRILSFPKIVFKPYV